MPRMSREFEGRLAVPHPCGYQGRVLFACLCIACLTVAAAGQETPFAIAEPGEDGLSLPDAVLGRPYSVALPLIGAVGRVNCQLVAGAGQLPSGLMLRDHWLEGTPRQVGECAFSVVAQDELGQRDERRFRLRTLAPPAGPLGIEAVELRTCVACVPYTGVVRAEGGYPPYRWVVREGVLPPGLTFKDGVISGMVRQAVSDRTTFAFNVSIVDDLGQRSSRSCELVLAPNESVILRVDRAEGIVVGELPPAVHGQSYCARLPFAGGYGHLSWSLVESLPDGLALVDGVIAGSARQAGVWNFSVTLRDELGQELSQRFRLAVLPPVPPPVRIVTAELPAAILGEQYVAVLKAEGGVPPYRWTGVNGALPEWAEFQADMIRGVPANVAFVGEVRLSVKVADAVGGEDGPTELVLAVRANPQFPGPLVTSRRLPPAIVGAAYDGLLMADGGHPPHSFEILSGRLPPGLAMEATGRVHGQPEAEGEWSVESQVTDALGQTSPPTNVSVSALKLGACTLRLGPMSLLYAVTNQEWAYSLPIAGGVLPYRFSVDGALPPGIAIDAQSGQLAGKPTEAGSWRVTLCITDASPEEQEVIGPVRFVVLATDTGQAWAWTGGGLGAGLLLGAGVAAFYVACRRRFSLGTAGYARRGSAGA